ncbi:MAG: hypothetical protein AABY22_11015 [Nanoarchaeota archaeon]
MNKFIFCETDDFRPSLISKWYLYWDKLKQEFPDLKVTVYVPTNYQEFGETNEDIQDNEEFEEWFIKRKDWIEINLHGTTHRKPPTYLLSYNTQKKDILNSIKILKPYINIESIGFKAPFYRMNDITKKVLKNCHIKWFNLWWKIFTFEKTEDFNYVVLGTHTGNYALQKNPDDIEIIFDELREKIKKFKDEKYIFSTIGEEIKNYITK